MKLAADLPAGTVTVSGTMIAALGDRTLTTTPEADAGLTGPFSRTVATTEFLPVTMLEEKMSELTTHVGVS